MCIAYYRGPGGLDDAVQMDLRRDPERYAEPLVALLKGSKPATFEERLALSLIEFVRSRPGVDSALSQFAASHPDPDVRGLVTLILNSPVPNRGAP